METDEIVKRNLDRKDKVFQIRSKVDEVIKKSMIEVIEKSPSRRTKSPNELHGTQSQYLGASQY